MKYPKKLMTRPELMKMGFSRRYLERAYNSPSNNFATKITPEKEKSHIIFDTELFEEWQRKQIKAQRGRK